MLAPTHSRATFGRLPARQCASLPRQRMQQWRRRCEPGSGAAPTTAPANASALFADLDAACEAVKKAPPSMKFDYSADVLGAMEALKAAGAAPKWGAGTEGLTRRNVFQGELRQVGIKQPDQIAVPSVRNDAAFLASVVGICSVVAVVLGQLPGDWGFFGSYLTGGIVLVVLAVGSTAPGLLQVVIDKFSQVFPDYKERVITHESAHFLLGYLMGVPITAYSLGIGQEHVEFAEAKLQRRIIEQQLEDEQINALAVMSVAGIAAEGMTYPEVMGQTADLLDLQRILLRSKTRLPDSAQQNITRWAVWTAAAKLRRYKNEFKALQEAVARGAPVAECVRIIESTATAE